MKSIRYAIAALLLAFGAAGIGFAQDYGYDEAPAQKQAAPQNPVQAKYADGKVIVVVHNLRHYGFRIGDRIGLQVVVVSDPSVTINVDAIVKRGILSQTGSDFELAAPAVVRTEQQDGKNITLIDLTLRTWVTVDQSSGQPKNSIGFTADFLYATDKLPDGRPQWVPATTPEFIVTTSNTATDSSKNLEMGDTDQKPYPNPSTVTPLRIAGLLMLLIPLSWLCFLVYRRINPPREVPANEKAWIAFDRILRESEGSGGITYEATGQIAHALRAYLQVESLPTAEVQEALETFFAYDEEKRYELTRVAQEALAILDRALYERPTEETRTPVLSNANARELFARIDRVVPRP